MLLKDNRKRALRGFIESELIASKILYMVTGYILLGYLAISIIIDIVTLNTNSQSHSNGGALNTGFGTIAITMFIYAIVIVASKENFKACFIFPLDRLTYILGNLIIFAVSIIGLLLLVSLVYIFETVIFNILASIYDNFIYINSITLEGFLAGFWTSFCYIFAFTVITFLVFLLFVRFKLPGIISFIMIAGLPIFFGIGRSIYYKLIMFFVKEQSIVLLSIKLLLVAFAAQVISYFIIRNMEVNN